MYGVRLYSCRLCLFNDCETRINPFNLFPQPKYMEMLSSDIIIIYLVIKDIYCAMRSGYNVLCDLSRYDLQRRQLLFFAVILLVYVKKDHFIKLFSHLSLPHKNIDL